LETQITEVERQYLLRRISEERTERERLHGERLPRRFYPERAGQPAGAPAF
jgi:hypothetical protein